MAMFETRQYKPLAIYWANQFAYYRDNKPDSAVVDEMYRRFKKMLILDNPRFKESVFDQASGYTS